MVAFAGIGRPEKFFTMLRDGGVTLSNAIAFADHHRYAQADIAALRAHGLPLLTTAKDAVKLPSEFLQEVTIVEVALQYEQQEAFESWLKERMESCA
jgi:tetraacyldisaccharide 4'-kinase